LAEELAPPPARRAVSDRGWVDHCWTAGRPILGICYGMQLLNALAGGTIYGDVERQCGGARSHSQKRDGTSHPVRLAPSSHLHDLLGQDTLSVNTRHLQAIASLGEGFAATAVAPDGVVEAIEHENGRVWGTQFHPERMGEPMQPLFESFVALAGQARPALS